MKQKVALCIRGAVSKTNRRFTSPSELYKDGKYVNYKACYISIIRHIVNYNTDYDFDIFIHSWNIDLKEDLCKLYKPKKFLFENNDLYKDEILNKINDNAQFAQCSQSIGIKKSIELMNEYEMEENIIYDIVIIYRPDVLLWKDMDLKKLQINSEYIYVNGNCNGDFHFIMNSGCAKEFANLYYSIDAGNKPIHHHWIQQYIRNWMNKKLIMDDIKPGRDQEVLRKIKECSISKGHLSIEKLREYGIEDQY
jgi:hypothetical protein